MFKIVLPITVLISIINVARGGDNSDISIVPVFGAYHVAEGPHWDEANNVLYFVDVYRQTIHRWDPASDQITYAYIKNGPTTVVIPIEGKENTFVVTSGKDVVEVKWDPSSNDTDPNIKVIQQVDEDRPHNRINDGKVDPKGRFWTGTMAEIGLEHPPNQAALYRFDIDGSITKIISPVTNSNGLTWSHNNDTFYYIDSPTKKIFTFDYDNESGDISNRQVLFDFNDHGFPGVPDGMTIDTEGNLWVAENHGSGKVIRIDAKTGELLRVIKMPMPLPTSVVFGGANKDILYVTSEYYTLSDAELKQYPQAGSVFAIYGLGVCGSTMQNYKLSD